MNTLLDLWIDGRAVRVPSGITVAAALMLAGCSGTRLSRSGEPRRAFCGMGQCQECRVCIDAQPQQLACLRRVAAGMRIETGERA